MPDEQNQISREDFRKVIIRVGTITAAEPFPEARQPAYKLWIDFGAPFGIKRSSAQITDRYQPDELIGKQVLAVINFPVKQIGPFMSEVLVTGAPDADGTIILAQPAPNGARLL